MMRCVLEIRCSRSILIFEVEQFSFIDNICVLQKEKSSLTKRQFVSKHCHKRTASICTTTAHKYLKLMLCSHQINFKERSLWETVASKRTNWMIAIDFVHLYQSCKSVESHLLECGFVLLKSTFIASWVLLTTVMFRKNIVEKIVGKFWLSKCSENGPRQQRRARNARKAGRITSKN